MKLPLFPDCVVQEYHSVAMLEITQKLIAFESHVCSFSYHNINCGFHHLISSIKQVQIFAIKILSFPLAGNNSMGPLQGTKLYICEE